MTQRNPRGGAVAVGHLGDRYGPGRRYTMPPFITNCARRSAVMSAVGSPATAIRSASRPARTLPIRSSRCKTFALTDVAARTAWRGDMPYDEQLQLASVVAVGEDPRLRTEAHHGKCEQRRTSPRPPLASTHHASLDNVRSTLDPQPSTLPFNGSRCCRIGAVSPARASRAGRGGHTPRRSAAAPSSRPARRKRRARGQASNLGSGTPRSFLR
jgi:hypothetical protein